MHINTREEKKSFCFVFSALNTKTLFTAFIWLSSHSDLETYLPCSCSTSQQKKTSQTKDESAHGGSMFFFLFLINQ